MIRHFFKKLLFFVSVTFLFWGCGGSNHSEGGIGGTGNSALKSPSEESLDLDIELLAVASTGKKGKEGDYFTKAKEVAEKLNSNIRNLLATPLKILKSAKDVDGELLSNGSTNWDLTINTDNGAQQFKLVGTPQGSEVLWKVIEVKGAVERIWLRGSSNTKDEGGFWELYDLDGSGSIVISVQWELEGSSISLTIQNLNSDSDSFGNTVSFSETNDQAQLIFYQLSKDSVIEMAWDQKTGEGGIRDPELNDGRNSQWNDTQENIDLVDEVTFVPEFLSSEIVTFLGVNDTLGGFSQDAGANFLHALELGVEIDKKGFENFKNVKDVLSQADTTSRDTTTANSYFWSWNGVIDTENFEATLRAKIQGQHIRWKLWVKKDSDLISKAWLQGFSNKEGDRGYLQLVSRFDFEVQILSFQLGATKKLIYKEFGRGNLNRGDFLKFKLDNESAQHVMFQSEKDSLIKLNWAISDFSGEFTDPDFNDGQLSAWDNFQQDL